MNRDLDRSKIRRGGDRDEKKQCPHRESKSERQIRSSRFNLLSLDTKGKYNSFSSVPNKEPTWRQ